MRIIWIFLALYITFSFSAYAEPVNDRYLNSERQVSQNNESGKWSPPFFWVDPTGRKPFLNSEDTKRTEAEKREIADLAAQEGMNRAAQAMNEATQRLADDTESIAIYTFWLTAATLVTAVLLIFTVIFTFKANQTANASLKETKRANILQLKPWISIEKAKVEAFTGFDTVGEYRVVFESTIPVINNGKTPVSRAVLEVGEFYIFIGETDSDKIPLEEVSNLPIISTAECPINPDGKFSFVFTKTFMVGITGREFASDQVHFMMLCKLRLKDISTDIGKHRCISFIASFMKKGERLEIMREDICGDGKYFDWKLNMNK